MEAQTRVISVSLTVVVLTIVVLLAGCASDEPATPTPEKGSLGEGEAIAVVQSELASRRFGELTCLELVSYRGSDVWTEEYLGNGVWSVTGIGRLERFQGRWKVFEGSLAVSKNLEEAVARRYRPGC